MNYLQQTGKEVLLCILALLFSTTLFAWGKTGHEITAEIAVSLLSDKAKDNLYACLGNTTIQEASVWMDQIKSDHRYDFMKPWHYINIEEGGTYDSTQKDNIIYTLKNVFRELSSHDHTLTAEKKKEDVMILIHLMGDIQQPLHVGYGSDKGGNTVQVRFNGRGTNLHRLWDSDIIEYENITTASVLAQEKHIARKGSVKRLKITPRDLEQYMYENRSLLKDVYNFKGHKIGSSYADKNKDLIEHQLYNGGVRLAAMLETIFG